MCYVHNSLLETVEHLFLKYGLSRQCWGIINLAIGTNLQPLENLASLQHQISEDFSWIGDNHSYDMEYKSRLLPQTISPFSENN